MTSSLAETPDRAAPVHQENQPPSSTPTESGKEQATGTSRAAPDPNGHGQHAQDGGGLNEQSPLLSPSSGEDDGFLDPAPASKEVDEHQTTKGFWYLIVLTISIGGLQIAWSVETSNGTPYLLSLGVSKSILALVWIAGPLSGTLVQPYVGMLSDKCRVPWGKRKPFMLGGAAATIVSLMCLAWTKEAVSGFLALFGADPESQFVKVCVIVFAVIWVYVLDFAINTVQAAIRAFIVDCAPIHQQETANAMASRFVGFGNIAGYLAGYMNLPSFLWFFGDTQFKDLCAIASIALGFTVILSCLLIKERDPRLEGPPPKDSPGVLAFFRKIFTSIKRLPPQTKKVCQVQFCAWIGFFPMLFYTSAYVGEIYAEPFLEKNPNMTPAELDQLYEEATRQGTFALLIFALVGLATNVFLPFFIAPTYETQPAVAASAPGEYPGTLKPFDDVEKSWLDNLVIPGFTLRRAWMLSQILFFVCMLCTVFVRSVAAATTLMGLVGITWALTLWAPWAIISAEISRRDELRRRRCYAAAATGRQRSVAGVASLDGYGSDESDERRLDDDDDDDDDDDNNSGPHGDDQAGVILGIHNMAIAAPQIIATVVSSIIFRLFQKPRGVPGDHSIAIVLALGGVTVLVSALFIHRIRDEPAPLPGVAGGDVEDGSAAGAEPGAADTDAGGSGGHLLRRCSSETARSEATTASSSRRSSMAYERAALARNLSRGGAEY
ncbi:hypothetical protein VTK26DRAFT_3289 [Humicola hyalothermophila]